MINVLCFYFNLLYELCIYIILWTSRKLHWSWPLLTYPLGYTLMKTVQMCFFYLRILKEMNGGKLYKHKQRNVKVRYCLNNLVSQCISYICIWKFNLCRKYGDRLCLIIHKPTLNVLYDICQEAIFWNREIENIAI